MVSIPTLASVYIYVMMTGLKGNLNVNSVKASDRRSSKLAPILGPLDTLSDNSMEILPRLRVGNGLVWIKRSFCARTLLSQDGFVD